MATELLEWPKRGRRLLRDISDNLAWEEKGHRFRVLLWRPRLHSDPQKKHYRAQHREFTTIRGTVVGVWECFGKRCKTKEAAIRLCEQSYRLLITPPVPAKAAATSRARKTGK